MINWLRCVSLWEGVLRVIFDTQRYYGPLSVTIALRIKQLLCFVLGIGRTNERPNIAVEDSTNSARGKIEAQSQIQANTGAFLLHKIDNFAVRGV